VSVSEFPKGSPAKRPIYQRNAERFPDKLGTESTISIVLGAKANCVSSFFALPILISDALCAKFN
jgi:hypothetical protein